MKRWGIPVIIILLLIISCVLRQTAMDPQDFSGEWYSSQDQCIYLFRDGLIYCRKYNVPLSGSEFISGAYAYSGKSVYLFAVGIDGLEKERELYLVENSEESMLCEKDDGSGKIFFVRDNRGK